MNKNIIYCIIIYIVSFTQIASASPETVYFYASQANKATLDQGEGGGNPFASAFVETISSKNISFFSFQEKIIKLTKEKSHFFQEPEIVTRTKNKDWVLFSEKKDEKRVALIFVYSNYKKTNLPSLPGAKNDLFRIKKALEKSRFDVVCYIDPSENELKKILENFSQKSKKADIALIYVTGHGGEKNNDVYLLSSRSKSTSKVNPNLVEISKLGEMIYAKKANLIFYGGCRTPIEN